MSNAITFDILQSQYYELLCLINFVLNLSEAFTVAVKHKESTLSNGGVKDLV